MNFANRQFIIVCCFLASLGCGADAGKKLPSRRPPDPEAPVIGSANLHVQVKFRGQEIPPIEMIRPDKDRDRFPPTVLGKGWRVDPATTRGIAQTFVCLRPPQNYRLPGSAMIPRPISVGTANHTKYVDVLYKDGAFEPRVAILQADKQLKVTNGWSRPFGVYVTGPNTIVQNLQPAEVAVFKLDANDREPNILSTGLHPWLKGYVWKPRHRLAGLSDVNGIVQLKNVPVLDNGLRYQVWVWHEMLPADHWHEIGPVQLEVGIETNFEINLGPSPP